MKTNLFIGTYTRRDSEGIVIATVNEEMKTAEVNLAHKEEACTYLVKTEEEVYSVFKDDQGAGLLVFDSELNLKNKIYSGENSASCHVAKHPTLDLVATTNYGEGSLQLFSQENHEYKLTKRVVDEEGSHQHFVYFSRNSETVIVCDLGLNKIVTYDYDLNVLGTVQFDEIEGPRHFVTNRDETFFFVLCELSNRLIVLRKEGLSFQEVERHDLLEFPEVDGNNAAAIRMTRNEKFIYTSVRNQEETVVVFKNNDGNLEFIQRISAAGIHPRDINLSKNEAYLIVANKDSDNVVYFNRDEKSGHLEYDFEFKVAEPVCIVV